MLKCCCWGFMVPCLVVVVQVAARRAADFAAATKRECYRDTEAGTYSEYTVWPLQQRLAWAPSSSDPIPLHARIETLITLLGSWFALWAHEEPLS